MNEIEDQQISIILHFSPCSQDNAASSSDSPSEQIPVVLHNLADPKTFPMIGSVLFVAVHQLLFPYYPLASSHRPDLSTDPNIVVYFPPNAKAEV